MILLLQNTLLKKKEEEKEKHMRYLLTKQLSIQAVTEIDRQSISLYYAQANKYLNNTQTP